MITIKAKKQYGERVVLDVDLSFAEGKRYAVIGANGSGKSTLLKILAGQLKSVGSYSPRQNDVGYMPQDCFAFSLSLKNNVRLACPEFPKLFSGARKLYYKRCDTLIKKMGLHALRKKNAAKLSGGETQRMTLCRVLVDRHSLLLLDEPTSAMDVNAVTTAESALGDYLDEYSPTLIFATHSIAQAERMADEVIFMFNGIALERGTPKQIFNGPRTDELKAFLKNI